MEMNFASKTLKNKKVKLFYGDKDPFIKDQHLKTAHEYLQHLPQLEIINFNGDHRVVAKVLKENLE
jgi:predicted esterase